MVKQFVGNFWDKQLVISENLVISYIGVKIQDSDKTRLSLKASFSILYRAVLWCPNSIRALDRQGQTLTVTALDH
jgi:hypothetical protein